MERVITYTIEGRTWRLEEHALRALTRRLAARGAGPGVVLRFARCGEPRLEDGKTLVDVAGMLRVPKLVLPEPWAILSGALQERGARWGMRVHFEGGNGHPDYRPHPRDGL